MNTTKTTAAPTWDAFACTRDRFGIAPYSSVQGSGLPFAAVRHDDARVPEPRGLQR